MKKIGMVSLGCAKNLVDSEVMLGTLARQGYSLSSDADQADVVIVNTCGFIDSAKEESIQAILEMAELKKQGRLTKLIVTGCLSQRYHQEMREELPEVDIFLGTNGPAQILDAVGGAATLPENWNPDFLYSAGSERLLSTAPHTAYVKIAEGCDHQCSFCIIPSLRGRSRSRPMEDIAAEVQALAEKGVREVNLVAQDSTAYGRDLGLTDGLAKLLRRLTQTPMAWIRVHYMYPYQITRPLLEVMNHPSICPYLDIPLQHADRRILAAMQRGSGRPQLARFLARLRQALPRAFLRSSFIVGFPGEDEMAFRELLSFVGEQQFDYLGAFTYSHEEGTRAHSLQDAVPEELKGERKARLLECQKAISRKRLRRLVGQTLDVLIEGPHPETPLLLRGRHAGQAPEVDGEVLVTSGAYAVGEIVPITIESSFDYDLAGRNQGGFSV